jgi:NADH dehydrogenase (ubiquinone) 1 beta subcomplex subunit 3
MPGKSIGFQWEKYEAWRFHPQLTFNYRNLFPGLGLGLTAFAVYVAYDQLLVDHSKKEHH